MNKRFIVAVVGEAASGKSTASRWLESELGFTRVGVSDLLRDYAIQNGLPHSSRAEYAYVHRQMKAKRGPDIIVDTILGVQEPRICVDGLRVINDLKRLRSAPLVVSRTIAFDCPAEVRFARACARRVGPDKPTLEAFMRDDIGDAWSADPEEPNALAVMNGADFRVDASRPIEEVMASIRAVVLDLC